MGVICKGNKRKYYRFRADRFYGGIATADCMGCNMECAFCWSYRTRIHPERFGDFYTPEEVLAAAKEGELRCLNGKRWDENAVLIVVDASLDSIWLNYFKIVVPRVKRFYVFSGSS